MLLRTYPVGALASLGLKGFNLVSRPLQSASHETANRMRLPAHLVPDFGQSRAVLAHEHGYDLRGLATLTWRAGFALRRLGGLAPRRFGRLLGGSGLLPRLPLPALALRTRGRGVGGFCGRGVFYRRTAVQALESL